MDILKSLFDFIAVNRKPEVIDIEIDGVKTGALITPTNLTAKSVEDFVWRMLPAPRRKTGNVVLRDLDSFAEFTAMHKEDTSTVFIKPDTGAMVAVLNFHNVTQDGQRWGDWRCSYTPQFSPEWKTWTEKSGKLMPTGDFAVFIDENLEDLTQPPVKDSEDAGDAGLLQWARHFATTYASREDVITLSRGMRIHADEQVQDVVNTATGEMQVAYASSHKSPSGDNLVVPGLFCIAVPIFEHGQVYRLPCRLIYRKIGGGVSWAFNILDRDKAVDHAIAEMRAKVSDVTTLPVYFGDSPDPAKSGKAGQSND